jgi:monoamine oxidase
MTSNIETSSVFDDGDFDTSASCLPPLLLAPVLYQDKPICLSARGEKNRLLLKAAAEKKLQDELTTTNDSDDEQEADSGFGIAGVSDQVLTSPYSSGAQTSYATTQANNVGGELDDLVVKQSGHIKFSKNLQVHLPSLVVQVDSQVEEREARLKQTEAMRVRAKRHAMRRGRRRKFNELWRNVKQHKQHVTEVAKSTKQVMGSSPWLYSALVPPADVTNFDPLSAEFAGKSTEQSEK